MAVKMEGKADEMIGLLVGEASEACRRDAV